MNDKDENVFISQSFILTIVWFPQAFYAWTGCQRSHQRAVSLPVIRRIINPCHWEGSCMQDARLLVSKMFLKHSPSLLSISHVLMMTLGPLLITICIALLTIIPLLCTILTLKAWDGFFWLTASWTHNLLGLHHLTPTPTPHNIWCIQRKWWEIWFLRYILLMLYHTRKANYHCIRRFDWSWLQSNRGFTYKSLKTSLIPTLRSCINLLVKEKAEQVG